MHIHILGICGTFMGSLALVARQMGHRVGGSDVNVYPPMSTQLAEQGIACAEGYARENLKPEPDLVLIGNALSRGNPEVEYLLERGLPYLSGPQWLLEAVLASRWTLAVAGTHGKTTTSAMLAWILEYAGLKPGFLIGGVPLNFPVSARLGDGPFFVVEADEYDSAFFDKRSKFVHYRPRTLILNNLEYDHADIFPDLAAIQRQFHHLLRTVPGNGLIIRQAPDPALDEVMRMGCWTPVENFGEAADGWRARAGGGQTGFELWFGQQMQAEIAWDIVGEHNRRNALAAIAAARHAGVRPTTAAAALKEFRGVKRRLEVRGEAKGVTVYDDFAHHPTAIRATLKALRDRVGRARIIAVLEPRSNTMRLGVHRDTLLPSLERADLSLIYQPANLGWEFPPTPQNIKILSNTGEMLDELIKILQKGDQVIFMSNGGFDNLPQRLLQRLD